MKHILGPVHPRASGEHRRLPPPEKFSTGSSPRQRGTRRRRPGRFSLHRFIPAPAGNTTLTKTRPGLKAVHPRASGEHLFRTSIFNFVGGSSPRQRGTLLSLGRIARRLRFIPAPAGNTRTRVDDKRHEKVHPRASGEHNSVTPAKNRINGSSPRQRGTLPTWRDEAPKRRFIPAPAGNTQ